jgi:hypothetical protein
MRGSHAENQVATMKRTKSVSKRPRFRDTDQENQTFVALVDRYDIAAGQCWQATR